MSKKFFFKIELIKGCNWITKLYENNVDEKSCVIELHGSTKFDNDDVNLYADAIYQTLHFVSPESEVVIFSQNVYLTNAINSWLNEVSDVHPSWKKVKELTLDKEFKVSAYTNY